MSGGEAGFEWVAQQEVQMANPLPAELGHPIGGEGTSSAGTGRGGKGSIAQCRAHDLA